LGFGAVPVVVVLVVVVLVLVVVCSERLCPGALPERP
jgi:hypothetical protein